MKNGCVGGPAKGEVDASGLFHLGMTMSHAKLTTASESSTLKVGGDRRDVTQR